MAKKNTSELTFIRVVRNTRAGRKQLPSLLRDTYVGRGAARSEATRLSTQDPESYRSIEVVSVNLRQHEPVVSVTHRWENPRLIDQSTSTNGKAKAKAKPKAKAKK